MAPQKTMAVSQQPAPRQGDQQALNKHPQVKSKKRKAKQQQVIKDTPLEQSKQQVKLDNKNDENIIAESEGNVCAKSDKPQPQQTKAPVVPSERMSVKKSQQVPSQVREFAPEINGARRTAVVAPATIATQATNLILAKQISSEETDDIDAGIDLDGSSYSGSSVKDITEDHTKSTSVSPVMAQSNLVNDSGAGSTKHAIQVSPMEQLAGSLCTAVDAAAKKISSTRQQLAVNQQVIDADEQQLQMKLENKQRRTSVQQNGIPNNGMQNNAGGDKAQSAASENSARFKRRFSTQSSQEAQDAALCKVCEQHVYQMERMMAEKSLYHKRCFRCHQCKTQLRIDNYSSHEGQVYCKAHHRQIFQPQVKLDNDDDVDIVAKSTSQSVDDYLTHRGRLSERAYSFLHQNSGGIQKRQMIICENEPAELPKDVVRSDTKVDDGIGQLNLNLNNILEKFERGTASDESQPSSAGIVIEKPSFNIKKTLMAFESRLADADSDDTKKTELATERPVVKKLTNIETFLNRQNSQEGDQASSVAAVRPTVVRRSGSLMMRLKKYESRIAGERVDDDSDDENSHDDENNNGNSQGPSESDVNKRGRRSSNNDVQVKRVTSINLSSLKNQWENGDINNRRFNEDDEEAGQRQSAKGDTRTNSIHDGIDPATGKEDELCKIRQQLARKRTSGSEPGGGSVRNIYEKAIKETQLQSQKLQASKRESSDLSALDGFSATTIQQQLLKQNAASNNSQNTNSPNSPNKDHFQLNLTNKANKLKEKFELGLINNSSRDDSGQSDDEEPAMTKLEQIRQEKMEDLSVFTDGEIKAREARSLFQQIDRRISATNGKQPVTSSKSLASIGASMRAKLTNQMSLDSNNSSHTPPSANSQQETQQPIRLRNNVKT